MPISLFLSNVIQCQSSDLFPPYLISLAHSPMCFKLDWLVFIAIYYGAVSCTWRINKYVFKKSLISKSL